MSKSFSICPHIITNIDGVEHQSDVFSNDFSKNRTVYITGEITDETATVVISQLRYLSDKSDDDIVIVINSQGGSVTAGLAIYDVIKYLKCDVITVGAGIAASMGAFLLASGSRGKRYALQHCEIMIHQPLGGMHGQVTDIKIHAERIIRIKQVLNKLLSESTGQPIDIIEKDTERDFFMNAEKSLEYGIIDRIIN